MDPRQQNQNSNNLEEDPPLRAPYGFNSNDPYHSFLHHNNEPTFNPSWDSESFNNPPEPTNAYDHNVQPWHPNGLQNPHVPSVPNYAIQSGHFDQIYSRNPASFNYPPLNQGQNPGLSPAAYDHSLVYGNHSLSNDGQYGFSRNQAFQSPPTQSQTISPQALQNYPATGFQQSQPQRLSQNQYDLDPTLAGRKPSAAYTFTPQPPITRQGWSSLISAMPESKVQGVFLVKSALDFPTSTNSKQLARFTFVGAEGVEVNTTKATVPRYNRRRSKNEIRRFLLQEKGTGPWPPSREPLLKKLKISAKSTLSRASSVSSRGTSAIESPSPVESSSESEPGDDSEYDSGSDQEGELDEKSPLPAERPIDPIKGTEYDTIKAVWAKRRVHLSGIVIRTALSDYWTVAKGIRDSWKKDTAILQEANEKKERAKIIEYERRVANQRKLMDSCIHLTLEHGHPDIIERLGENPNLLLAFYQFIAKENDYTGSLVTNIMELVSRFTNPAMLEKTKLDKVLPRVIKRGSEKGKVFAQKAQDNISAASKQKALDSKTVQLTETKGDSVARATTASSQNVGEMSGFKKPIANGSVGQQSVRKTGAANAATTSSAVAVNTKSSGSITKKPPTESRTPTTAKPTTTPTNAPKTKINHVPAKPSAFFTSLQSASKKPGTSNAALQSAKLKDNKDGKDGKDGSSVERPSTASAVSIGSAVPKPAFSFAETLANLHKSKEAAPSKSEDPQAPETPEQRRKRLRKEDRRKLRVSFKPDDSLVEIRVFEHHPDEEMGHDGNMVRDVNDIKGEGQMLKMHRERDVADDEDEDPAEEIFGAWISPTLTDFYGLKERDNQYISRGGTKVPESEEKAVQEQREMTTLMVIYTSPLDIPPSPREPADQDSEAFEPPENFGPPNDDTKAREAQYYASQNSQNQPQMAMPSQTPDISHLLSYLSHQQNQQTQPQPQVQQPVQQPVSNGLEAIFAQFSKPQQQVPQMYTPQMTQQPTTSSFDISAALAVINQNNQTNTGYNMPQGPAAPNVDLSSILAQIQPQQAPAPMQSMQPGQNMQGYSYGNLYQNENDRKRPMDHEDQGSGYSKGKRVKSGMDGKKKPFYGVPHVPCKFWHEGTCRKGDECTFLHE